MDTQRALTANESPSFTLLLGLSCIALGHGFMSTKDLSFLPVVQHWGAPTPCSRL